MFVDKRLKHALANELIRRGLVCWGTDRLLPTNMPRAALGSRPRNPMTSRQSLVGNSAAKFSQQAASERDIRVRPADNVVWLRPKARDSKTPTAVAWRVPEVKTFGAFVRIVGRSKPVEFLFEVVDAEALDGHPTVFGHGAPMESQSVVVTPEDPYRRVQIDIPQNAGEAVVRVICRMADPDVEKARVYGYVAEPRSDLVLDLAADESPATPGAPRFVGLPRGGGAVIAAIERFMRDTGPRSTRRRPGPARGCGPPCWRAWTASRTAAAGCSSSPRDR